METLQIKDKKFAVSIPESEILKQVKRVAGEINRDLAGTEPVFLAILNGSFIFAADLMREIRLAAQISFVKLASYVGTSSTGRAECRYRRTGCRGCGGYSGFRIDDEIRDRNVGEVQSPFHFHLHLVAQAR